MKILFANKLKAARLMAGLSQKELSEKMNLSKQAISKYENGLMFPDSSALIQLTIILNRKADYFFRTQKTILEKVDFRKKNRLSGKKLASLKAQIIDKLERYLELESLLGYDDIFVNPIQNRIIESVNDVENAVDILLQKWNLGLNPVPNFIELLENKGIKVVEIQGNNDFDGLSAYVDDVIPVIVINSEQHIVRKRFTILHELGHLLLSIPESFSITEKEKFCNRFAGAMLIPKSQIKKELGIKRKNISINELVELKEYYGISIAALIYRAKDLNIISETIANRFWKLRNQNIHLKNEIGFGNYEGKEHSGRFEQLLYKAIAEEMISLNKAAILADVEVNIIKNNLELV